MVTTLGPVTATANHVPARMPGTGAARVVLDASVTTHCRRRIHLDHDPSAVAAPRALPDPSSAQRRADAAEHRVRIGALLAAAAGEAWHAVPADAADRVACHRRRGRRRGAARLERGPAPVGPARCRTGWAAPVGAAPSCWCACPAAATCR